MVLYRGTINSRATSINLLSLQALTRQEKLKTGKEKLTLLSQLQPVAHTYSTAPRDRNLLQSTLKFIDNATKRKKREGKKEKRNKYPDLRARYCFTDAMKWFEGYA